MFFPFVDTFIGHDFGSRNIENHNNPGKINKMDARNITTATILKNEYKMMIKIYLNVSLDVLLGR